MEQRSWILTGIIHVLGLFAFGLTITTVRANERTDFNCTLITNLWKVVLSAPRLMMTVLAAALEHWLGGWV